MTEEQTSQTTELIALSTLASSLEKLESNREETVQAAINSVTGIGLLAKKKSL